MDPSGTQQPSSPGEDRDHTAADTDQPAGHHEGLGVLSSDASVATSDDDVPRIRRLLAMQEDDEILEDDEDDEDYETAGSGLEEDSDDEVTAAEVAGTVVRVCSHREFC